MLKTKLIIGTGSVEIVSINHQMRTLYMVIKMNCTMEELHTDSVKEMILHKASFAHWYLAQEGFVESTEMGGAKGGWRYHIASVAIPPQSV